MKNHKKQYEDVFTSDIPKSRTKLNLEEARASGMEFEKYISLFKSFLTGFYNDLFLQCVRLSWLRRKFIYYNKKTILPMHRNPIILNNAFVKLMRRHIGKDLQIITKGKFFTKLELYFDELFPGFEDGDPFENPDYYRFPYKNISLEYLIVVHQMDDRLELLQKANEDIMTFAVFMDYIINHAYSENDRLGREKYQIRQNQDRNMPYYIKDVDKKLRAKRGRPRKK